MQDVREIFDRSWLVKARVRAGLNQRQVADACGISTGFYCKIENGIQIPTVKIALMIADAVGVDVRMFLTEQPVA